MAIKTITDAIIKFEKSYTTGGQPMTGKVSLGYTTNLSGFDSGRESFSIDISSDLAAAIESEIETAKGNLASADFTVEEAAEVIPA